jgi:DtxR family transcriptional regulator, Mn-dependent transcriptional regulator
MPNVSTEDYIKAIYKLQQESEKVTTSALAAELQLADASITEMLKKLSERNLVHYKRYQGVGLTAVGKRMALKIVRRHRLWEMFLVRFLGFSWDQVHEEAERLEHVTSDELEQRLDKLLGRPVADPHGDPIPTADGQLQATVLTALAEFVEGDIVRITRVSDNDPALLQHASKLGFTLNAKITIKEKTKFDGSMVVKVRSKEQFVSLQVAQSIFVESL